MFPNIAGLATLLLLAANPEPPTAGRDLRVGTAKVDITPDVPVALAGYPDPDGRISQGIHDRLYARAVAFRSGSKKLVLVSCDLSGFQYVPVSMFRKPLLARFNLQQDELFLCGTHTHSAPMLTINKSYPYPNNFPYTEALTGKLLEAVGRALNSAAPARLAAGIGHSPIAVNRRLPIAAEKVAPGEAKVRLGRNPDGPVDRDVLVLKIARPDGSPVAALFDYACHSRSLRGANRLISGDIFGIAEQFVERALGRGAVSPAFAGASGNVDPWYVVPFFSYEPGLIPETVLMGTVLGQEVVHVFRSLNAAGPGAEIYSKSQVLSLPGKTSGTPAPGAAAPARHLEITAARIGDIAFVGLDCEAFVEIGQAIRNASPFRHTFVVTNCNGGTGYLPPAHLYTERGYEVDLSGFGPEAAGMVVENALRLLSSLGK